MTPLKPPVSAHRHERRHPNWSHSDEGLRHRGHRVRRRPCRRAAGEPRATRSGSRSGTAAACGRWRAWTSRRWTRTCSTGGRMRRALSGCDVLFHTAGMVASRPAQQGLARERRRAPDRGRGGGPRRGRAGGRDLERRRDRAGAGRTGRRRSATPTRPAGTGLLYTDAKHEGELAALASRPSGWASRSWPSAPPTCSGRRTTARCRARPRPGSSANYLRGRLPAIVDSYTNIVDVEDVARGPPAGRRAGQAGRALHPRRREPALVGGRSSGSRRLSGVRHPADRAAARSWRGIADAAASARTSRSAIARGHPADGAGLALLVGAARRELGYQPRGANETLERTVDWYLELIEDDRLPAAQQQLVRPDDRRRPRWRTGWACWSR